MSVAEVAVSFGDEQPTVLMADPGGEGFEVHAFFEAVADEEMAHAMMGKVREAVELASRFQRFLCVLDGDQGLLCRPRTFRFQALQEVLQHREHRDNPRLMILCSVFAPGDREAAALEIHIGQPEGVGFRFAHPRIGEQFHQIGRSDVTDIQSAQSGDHFLELLAGGNEDGRFAQPPADDDLCRVVHDQPFALGIVQDGPQRFQIAIEGGRRHLRAALLRPLLALQTGYAAYRHCAKERAQLVDAVFPAFRRPGLEPCPPSVHAQGSQLAEGNPILALGEVETADLFLEFGQVALRQLAVSGLEGAADLLAALFQQRIIPA